MSSAFAFLLILSAALAAPANRQPIVLPRATSNFTPLTCIHDEIPVLHSRETPTKMIEGLGQVFYTAPVKIGSTTLNLFMDTGSHITWATTKNHKCFTIGGGTCTVGTSDNAHIDVTPSELSTGETFFIGYQDRSNATGKWVDRTVSLAGVTIPHQMVGAATTVYALSKNNAAFSDGMLGLGPWVGRQYPSPFFNALWNVGLSLPQFSIALFGDDDNNDNKRDGGLLAFGGYPASLELTSKWAGAPMITEGDYGKWYTIPVDGYVLNGKKISSGGIPMVVDSGTTISQLPPAVANEVFKFLPGEGTDPARQCTSSMDANQKCLGGEGWKIPCNGKMPSFSVVIGGMEFLFQADNLNVMKRDDYCIAGVMPAPAGMRRGVLGFSFMKNDVVVVHDYTNQKEPWVLMATYKDKEN